MKYTHDKKKRGHAMVFTGVSEVAESAQRGNTVGQRPLFDIRNEYISSFAQKKLTSWPAFHNALNSPWREGVQRVEEFLEELKGVELPQPKSRKRRARWSEENGEVEIDRIMQGEPAYYREVKRDNIHGPTELTLLCNLDAKGSHTAEEVFWRGAAAIAAADLLEDRGYSVTIWVWCAGARVYKYDDEQFTAFPIKHAGDPLDISTLVNALSCWFLRIGVFGTFADCPGSQVNGYGAPVFEIDGWEQYLDIPDTALQVHMPIALTKDEAIAAARGVLEQMEQAQERQLHGEG